MDYLFLVFLFIIAFMYSSFGHGGASGYLALMALFSISPVFMRSTALILNVFVSGIAFISYYKAGYFRLKLLFPFLVTSIPMAYFGASIHTNPTIYKIILGIFLLLAVIRMLFVPNAVIETSKNPILWMALLTGGILGFFSGMIGIGGGIMLSPLLILMHWANLKESAAVSALFILLNSLSGLFALLMAGLKVEHNLFLWIIIAVSGGLAGSLSGSYRLQMQKLKYLLACVLLIASIKLFIF